MSENTTNFINTIGVLARNEFLSRDRWVLPSVCIAQAALESGWNLNAKTLFGIRVKVLQRQQVSTMMDIMFRFRIHLEVIQMLRVQ